MKPTWLTCGAAAALLVGAASCGGPYLHAVDDGTYGALIPTTEQWADAGSEAIPGGFAALSADGSERVVVRIEGDTVSFELDGETAATRTVVERRAISDREGSGPFKAETQVLALGDEPLILGSLSVSEPVIWYAGGYESTTVVAIKPWDPEERGPIVQCAAEDEQCLELPVGETLVGNPIGEYTDMNEPGSDAEPGEPHPGDRHGHRVHPRHRGGSSRRPRRGGPCPGVRTPGVVGVAGPSRGCCRPRRPRARGDQLSPAVRRATQPDRHGTGRAASACAAGTAVGRAVVPARARLSVVSRRGRRRRLRAEQRGPIRRDVLPYTGDTRAAILGVGAVLVDAGWATGTLAFVSASVRSR